MEPEKELCIERRRSTSASPRGAAAASLPHGICAGEGSRSAGDRLRRGERGAPGPDELFNYSFAWGEGHEGCAIALGFGSLYNHSYRPNADHVRNFPEGTVTVTACRPIAAGEEITINYMGKTDCRDPVWFEMREKE
jgi:hypothetical protein